MNFFEKMLNVFKENFIYVAALLVALVLFFVYSDGLISGLITVIAAFVIYICGDKIYKEYKILDAKKAIKMVEKPAANTASKPVAKKATAKKVVKKKK